MKRYIDYSVYLVTDKDLMTTKTIEESVKLAISGGATVVQLREKNIDSLAFFEEALAVKKLCDDYSVPLIINDRIDIALAVNADGVHIGQSDIPASVARKIIGEDMILGVSATTLEEAIKAEADGADYLGVGAMFQTDTKTDAKIVSKDELNTICEKVQIPVVIIGGINERTIPMFDGCKIDGVAVVSAIVAKADITEAARTVSNLYHRNRIPVFSNKRLALFDLDGTLLNSLGVWVDIDRKFFLSRGIDMPSDFVDITMPMSFRECAEYSIKTFNLSGTPDEIIREWHDMTILEYENNIAVKPHAKEYLQELKSRNIKTAVVTSLSKELYMPVLKLNGLDTLFDYTFSVDEVGMGKSSGKIYEHAIKYFGESAENTILFEDIPDAALSGKKLGITVVGVRDNYNKNTLSELVRVCDYTFADYVNAPKVI